jgi:tyrosine phenol-lyase
MYFTTTRLHQELAGGRFVDVITPEAHDPACEHPFKGNMDLAALEAVIREHGRERIPYVCLHATVNMAGGQPVSLANAHAVRDLTAQHGIPVYMDATRAVENAYFIQQREPGQAGRPVKAILRELCSCADGCTMSGKKDPLVNIGGWLATDDAGLYEEASNLVVVFEGLHTYGGMAGRDMEAMARGIVESVQDDHIRARLGQVEYLGAKLIGWGIPVVRPSAATPSTSTPEPSTSTCRRIVSRPRCSRRSSTWTPACVPWNAASSRRAVIRRPANTGIPGLSSSA